MNCDQVWLALINNIPAITAAIAALGGILVSLLNRGKLTEMKEAHADTAAKVETLVGNTITAKPPETT